jgi:hypothetical protein
VLSTAKADDPITTEFIDREHREYRLPCFRGR